MVFGSLDAFGARRLRVDLVRGLAGLAAVFRAVAFFFETFFLETVFLETVFLETFFPAMMILPDSRGVSHRDPPVEDQGPRPSPEVPCVHRRHRVRSA